MVGIKQEFRQSQQLVMTQQLQQSIKLLQLSAVELQEFIDAEMEKNPLLSREESETENTDESAESEVAQAPPADEDERRADSAEVTVSDGDYSVAESLEDGSYGEEWTENDTVRAPEISAGAAGVAGGYESAEDNERFELAAARDVTLREHLMGQIAMDLSDPVEQRIAAQLVDHLDDAGYLREPLAPIAQALGIGQDELEAVIAKLQRMEPAGVFARDLAECLRLQLADMNRLDPVMETLLEHLEMIGRGESRELQRRCDVDDEDFAQMLADIRRCNPKPAAHFAREDAHAVIPDVLVRRGKGQSWAVELNPEALPRVLVNRHYAQTVRARKDDREAKKFVNEQLASANWLVKALDQRANTILKVASAIVAEQEKFLVHGIRFLKPLVLKDIAAAVGMHESTISRVTTAKFMATPRGTFELKFFFTSAINAAGGAQDFSSKAVMFYIKELVEAEAPGAILSDDAIVKRLKDRNIDVARRTVTKYREEMNIPSSVVRRRLKAG